ncbi:unnamed protein product [Dicrocoelium dendriticum]|nr:unnamed protein product [Dicrocoelium dendriticum]
MNYSKFTVKKCDMTDEMRDMALQLFNEAIEKCDNEKDICSYLKSGFDKEYQPTWHCIAGRDFASHVTYDLQNYIHFTHDNLSVLLYRCG